MELWRTPKESFWWPGRAFRLYPSLHSQSGPPLAIPSHSVTWGFVSGTRPPRLSPTIRIYNLNLINLDRWSLHYSPGTAVKDLHTSRHLILTKPQELHRVRDATCRKRRRGAEHKTARVKRPRPASLRGRLAPPTLHLVTAHASLCPGVSRCVQASHRSSFHSSLSTPERLPGRESHRSRTFTD